MADTPYKTTLTRNWWTGSQADYDAHIELYRNEIDQSFDTQSLFRARNLSEVVSVEGKSNTYRIDQLGAAKVFGRASGEEVQSQRAVNERNLIKVEYAVISRHSFDYNDDWTAPSIVSNVATEQGIAHAKQYDRACITQLIKAGEWQAPASLKATGNFFDGIRKELTGFEAEDNNAAKADMIFQAAKDAIADLTKRDLVPNNGEFVFLASPDWFNILLDHEKLMQQPFQADKGTNDLVHRRLTVLHGIPIIETPRITGQAITESPLGDDFLLTEEQAKAGLLLFHPRYTLVTVEAHDLEVRHWDEPKHMSHHLDSYSMYNVGIRRGDASAVIASD